MTNVSKSGGLIPHNHKHKPIKGWRYYTSRALRKLWLSCAVFIVALAVFMSVLRYSLPYMDSQKHHMEEWLRTEYGTDVKVGYISAMWKGKGPAIILKDLTIGDAVQSPISLTVDETQIELDFWASVQQQRIQSQRFNLIGLSLEVDIPRIEGGSGEDFPILDALQTLFLEQLERFSISDSEVLVRNRSAEQKFQIQQLSWLNDEQRHQGVGQMRVAELARNSAKFILDLHGSRDNFIGTFFAEAEDLDLSPWIQEAIPTEFELKHSRSNFKIWAGLKNTNISYLQAHLSESQFSWQNPQNEDEIKADLMKGSLYALPGATGWDFNLDDLTLIVNDRVFSSSWQGALSKDNVFTLASDDELNLGPLLPFVGVMMGEPVNTQLTALNPQITVQNARFYASKDMSGAKLSFQDLSIAETEQVPGVNAVSGEVSWLNNQGRLTVNSIHNYLSTEQQLGYLLPYDELTIDAYIDLTPENQQVYLPKLALRNPELSIINSLHYDIETGVMSAKLSAEDIELGAVKSYFPHAIAPETFGWLDRALQAGTVNGTQAIWQGKLAEFPFSENQGILQAGLNIDDLTLKYASEWPELTNANLALLFENESLFLTGEDGIISGVALNNATGFIPEFSGDSYIDIYAAGAGSGEAITSLFQQSSLHDSVGEALGFVEIKGGLNADINIKVPFYDEDLTSKADVFFDENHLFIPSLNMRLQSVKGTLKVDNANLSAQDIVADLLQQPMNIDIKAYNSDEGYKAEFGFNGNWDAKKLLSPHHASISEYLNGGSDWSGELALLFPEDGYSYSLQLTSFLQGIESQLPLSAGKAADEKLLFFLDSEGDKQASTVRVLLGKDIKFNGILPHETVQFSRAHLSVGGDNFVGMGLGFSVSADLEHLDYTLWQQFIGDLMNGLPDGNDAILSPPQRIFIESETAGIFGKKFDNVEILAKNRETLWELQIDADQARAEAILHKEWFDKGIELQADFIKIDKSEVLLTKAATAARDGVSSIAFPPLKVKCDHCSYHGYDIGKIELEMSRTDPGMSIDRLQVQLRDGRIDASGNWYISESSESTRLQGTFNSDDLGAFLKTLNFDSGIRDSDASMEFDLSWQDAPYAFTTESLGGGIDWRLGDGYLTEISDKGARLLSLLSLESLLRKLTLDFRDVFAKGFFYENMRGSFQLSDGLVSTEDTFIDGAAAGVTLKGNTDLNNNELNYLVNVSPKLTSNLPVLIAWMVNPATAVAALAFDEVFTSADVVSGIQYSLTGSLKEPQITLLEQTSRVVELPAQNRLSKPKSLPDNEASDELPGSSENGQYPYRQPPVEPIEQPQIQQESES